MPKARTPLTVKTEKYGTNKCLLHLSLYREKNISSYLNVVTLSIRSRVPAVLFSQTVRGVHSPFYFSWKARLDLIPATFREEAVEIKSR